MQTLLWHKVLSKLQLYIGQDTGHRNLEYWSDGPPSLKLWWIKNDGMAKEFQLITMQKYCRLLHFIRNDQDSLEWER